MQPKGASDISEEIEGLTLDPTPWTPRARSTAETAELPSVSEDYRRYGEPQNCPEDRHGPENQRYPEDLQKPEEQQYGDGQQSTLTQFYRTDTREFRSRKGKSRGVEEISCPICSMIFYRASDLERHHKTVHLNDGARPYQCLVDGCTANVRSWTTADKLRLHEKTWHAGDLDTQRSHTQGTFHTSSQPVFEVPKVSSSGYGFSYLAQSTTYDPQSVSSPQSSLQTRKVLTKNPQRMRDELDSSKSCNPIRNRALRGFQGFKVHRSREFEFGRVFKVLWSEPMGSGGTEITFEKTSAKYGENAFHKIRRFVIVKQRNGHSICIPIVTYGFQGVLKNGVRPEDHAIVYSGKNEVLEGEGKLPLQKPIRIETKDASQKLDPRSRLNYAKLYTVEHNVKVFFIGRVARSHEQEVIRAYNNAHPPLDPSPYEHQPDTPDELFSHAEGPEPTYPTVPTVPTVPMAIPTASYSSGAQQYSSSYATTNAYPYPGPGAQPYTHADVYGSQPEMPHAGQQQQPENQMYDDGYDVD